MIIDNYYNYEILHLDKKRERERERERKSPMLYFPVHCGYWLVIIIIIIIINCKSYQW